MSTYTDMLLPLWPAYVAMAVLVTCLVLAIVMAASAWTRESGHQDPRRPPPVSDRDTTPTDPSVSPAVESRSTNLGVSGYAPGNDAGE